MNSTSFGGSNPGIQVGSNSGTINQTSNHTDPLDKLPSAFGAELDSYKNQHEDECLPGTRIDLLHNIAEWAASTDGKCIFWLNGMAGTGKSTISRTVARSLKKDKLVVSFFFKRGEGDRGNATKFFTTISRQLAFCIPDLAAKLREVLSIDPDIPTRSLREQLNNLLLRPLQSLEQTSPHIPTIVLVIDALDECDNDNDIRYILQLLPRVQELRTIRLRAFLTSRPELAIRLGFSTMENHELQDFALHEIPEEVTSKDISLFLEDRFKRIHEVKNVPMNWPGADVIQSLVEISTPLFISAATVCRFIEVKLNPVECLTDLIKDQAKYATRMEKTYLPVLMRLLREQEDDEDGLFQLFHQVIGLIILLAVPLSANTLARLLKLDAGVVMNLLDHFQSVLSLPSDPNIPVRIFHLSFRDFLLQTRSKFSVNEKHTQKEITMHCLTTMRTQLKNNICNLESYGTLRTEIDPALISQCLQPELFYSCRYWVYHLERCADETQEVSLAFMFLEEHFLHWVEAMSLLGVISEVIGMIDVLQNMVQDSYDSQRTAFLHDAKRFVLKNQQIINEAPLQLYCAGLVFIPMAAIIRQKFQSELPAWICLLPQVEKEWSAELQTLEGHSGYVRSVTFSPDGRLLASASDDGTIRLWDPATGALQQTLEGHENVVTSVAFSPNGCLLASASYDCTIRLWDPTTGALQQILEGHEDVVTSVAFSPNGCLLASASYDCTIRLWDPTTGALQQTLEDHSWPVLSVVFSPDSWLLVSASKDWTIQLWDPATGMLQQTLKGHDNEVTSVAFSPNGWLLASASIDSTIQLWDLTTGALLQTLRGHSWQIASVVFSPDGWLLASASKDCTIRLWDPTTGTLQQTLKGHVEGVTSVAFSPHSWLLVSASDDWTIRLWNLATGILQQTFDGHSSTDWSSHTVNSVAFSPDGRLLASASNNMTVQLWDPATGILQQTLNGHLGCVRMVTFSPDGQLLASVSDDRTVQLWDPTTGALQQMLEGHLGYIRSISFSPDGRLLASASDDETVRLWDPTTGALQKTLEGHIKGVKSVAFSPDGRLLASASDDGIVLLWDPATGTPQWNYAVGIATKIEFSPDGSYLMTNSGILHVQSKRNTPILDLPQRSSQVSIDQKNWITLRNKMIIWLPPEYRPTCFTVYDNVLAIGHSSGRVSFMSFQLNTIR